MRKLGVPAVVALSVLLVACGGAPTPTRTGTAAPQRPSGGPTSPEALCGLLNAADWQQFNYVTAATPDVTDDGEGTAICTWASGLELEVYTHASEAQAVDTWETVQENVPIQGGQAATVPGAAQAVFDPDLGDGNAGMVVQSGRLVILVTGLSRDSAQAELTTLAGLVLARGSALI